LTEQRATYAQQVNTVLKVVLLPQTALKQLILATLELNLPKNVQTAFPASIALELAMLDHQENVPTDITAP
jgi:hypothetical protein